VGLSESVQTEIPAAERIEDIRDRLTRLLAQLDSAFLERQTHTRLSLLSLLSGHHMLMLGPPGTAKSLLARAACQCVRGGRYFEYLLSRFTHPDELFGPVSIPGLKEEDYRRLTDGYLPDAHVAFLDEIFKANSAILNSLLTLINERVFHHGLHRDPVPLLALIGASNESPDSESLAALYDRFLVRIAARPLAAQDSFLQVCLGEVPVFSPDPDDRLTLDDIAFVRAQARHVTAGPVVRAALVRLRSALQEEEIPASDRRWRWAVELVKIAALTSGRTEISPVDLLLLQHCFGTPFDTDARVQRRICREIVTAVHPIFDPQYPRRATAALRKPVDKTASFSAVRAERLAVLETLAERSASLKAVDMRHSPFLSEAAGATWLAEVPSEVFTAILVSRNAVREAMAPLSKAADAYRPRLLGYDPVGTFFGAFALQSQLQSVFLGNQPGRQTPLAWFEAPGSGQAALLTRAGQLLTDVPPGGADVPRLSIDADVLFDIGRPGDWRGAIRRWRAGGPALPAETEGVVVALLEQYRRSGAEPFPLMDDPEDEP